MTVYVLQTENIRQGLVYPGFFFYFNVDRAQSSVPITVAVVHFVIEPFLRNVLTWLSQSNKKQGKKLI